MIVFDERVGYNLTSSHICFMSAILGQAVAFMESNCCPLIGGDIREERCLRSRVTQDQSTLAENVGLKIQPGVAILEHIEKGFKVDRCVVSGCASASPSKPRDSMLLSRGSHDTHLTSPSESRQERRCVYASSSITIMAGPSKCKSCQSQVLNGTINVSY